MARLYSSTSLDTTLSATLGSSATTATVVDATALLGGVTLAPGDTFTIAFDPDTQSEEICLITAVSSNTITLTRAQAGTTGIEHQSGATVRHVLTSLELTDFETVKSNYITASSTNTLTNKTIDANSNTFLNIVTPSSSSTLTNKAISLGSNTVTGTTAQFNTALTDNDFATLAGTETLTNKTVTAPVVTIALNPRTAAYTLAASDRNKLVTITSSSAANFTVPSGVFSAGDVVYIARLGSGTVAATASGTTVNGTPGLNLRAQYSTAALICTASNTFLLVGDLSA
jgi:hypothetical protein